MSTKVKTSNLSDGDNAVAEVALISINQRKIKFNQNLLTIRDEMNDFCISENCMLKSVIHL